MRPGIIVILITLTATAMAETRPRHRLRYQNFTVFRVNPGGVQNQFELGYRVRLYDREDILFRTGYAGVSFNPTLTPALVRLGVKAEIEPLAVLLLSAKWEWIQYFGVLNHLQSFTDTDSDYSDTSIEARGESRAQGGWQLTLSAEVRAKLGPLVVRDRLNMMLSHFELESGHRVWYDPSFDLLTPDQGWSLTNDADLLLFLLNKRLIVGVRHNTSHAFYPDGALGKGGVQDNTPLQRLGPLVAWRFFDEPGAIWNRPTLVLLVNWYLEHPNRTGRDTSQALPYMAFGFAFSGDLLPRTP